MQWQLVLVAALRVGRILVPALLGAAVTVGLVDPQTAAEVQGVLFGS